MQVLFIIHSWLRWIVVLVAVIALVRFAMGLARHQAYDKMSNGLMQGFSGLLDLQATVGLVYLLVSGFGGAGFPMPRIEHAVTMIVAVVVAHLPARWKSAADPVRYRRGLLAVLGALLLIAAGVYSLGGGASRWQFRF